MNPFLPSVPVPTTFLGKYLLKVFAEGDKFRFDIYYDDGRICFLRESREDFLSFTSALNYGVIRMQTFQRHELVNEDGMVVFISREVEPE